MNGWVASTPNRELQAHEVPASGIGLRAAAKQALAVGFDGVELHDADDYLLDQFLQDGTNIRADSYGGSFENRTRHVCFWAPFRSKSGFSVARSPLPVFGGSEFGYTDYLFHDYQPDAVASRTKRRTAKRCDRAPQVMNDRRHEYSTTSV
jgi:hypothetical protein